MRVLLLFTVGLATTKSQELCYTVKPSFFYRFSLCCGLSSRLGHRSCLVAISPLWIRSLSRCLSLTTLHPSMLRWLFRLPICTTISRPRTLPLHRCPPTFISRSGVSIAALSPCGALPSLRDTPLRECLRVLSPQPRFSHFR